MIGLRRVLAALALRAAVVLANPPRGDLKSCASCGSKNEPDRTTCRNCGASF